MPDVDYILGHSPAEIRRLILQAGILKPITERLLRKAGVAHIWEQVMRLFAVMPPIIKGLAPISRITRARLWVERHGTGNASRI
jgi:hypothetical protein